MDANVIVVKDMDFEGVEEVVEEIGDLQDEQNLKL
jgi:hypothetical protein